MSQGPVQFFYEAQQPLPDSVCIAGEFNSWSPAPLLYSDASGRFETTVMLDEGKSYCYKFVVDGTWLLAPNAETVWDNGIENSVVRVSSDVFVKSESELETAAESEGATVEPKVPVHESEAAATESETPATAPEAPAMEHKAPAAESEAPVPEPEVPPSEPEAPTAPVTQPEDPAAGPEISASVITSEGYVLVQKTNGEVANAAGTEMAGETNGEEETTPIEAKVEDAAKNIDTKAEEVAAVVEGETKAAAAPVEAKANGVAAIAEQTSSSIAETVTKTVESAIVAATEVVSSAATQVAETAESAKEIAAGAIISGIGALKSTTISDSVPDISFEKPSDIPAEVKTEPEAELNPCSEAAPHIPHNTTPPSEMSSIERVVTANTTITTPEMTTPVKEDANEKRVPDAIPSSVPEEQAETSASPTPGTLAEPSTESPNEPAAPREISTGMDTAISIQAEPESAPASAAQAPGYETATKPKQPGLLDRIYEFISTSILGKLFQYVFSIFNRSA
ncbi:hypothetical protein V1517DRAFT_334933 [Lipomyces orientalis]|uniref:Uncharacterized protein n=1 Tax=Lipomyces orientalis TaxID=1233043 RepID=A0ACC3TZ64_9ASCO